VAASPPVFSEDLDTIQRLYDSANIVYEHLVREGLWSTVVKNKPPTVSQVLMTLDRFPLSTGVLNQEVRPEVQIRIRDEMPRGGRTLLV
jgi:hypothetical protein